MQTDQWIVTKIKQRNEEGIEILIKKYSGLLYAIILKHSYGYDHYKDDCFNEVVLAIWDNIDQYDESKNSFKNWIGAIARYRALNLVKKYSKETYDENYEDQAYSEASNVLDTLIIREDIVELISALSPKDQKLFKNLFYKGLTVKEISQQEKISENTIYQRVSRARKKLRGENIYE